MIFYFVFMFHCSIGNLFSYSFFPPCFSLRGKTIFSLNILSPHSQFIVIYFFTIFSTFSTSLTAHPFIMISLLSLSNLSISFLNSHFAILHSTSSTLTITIFVSLSLFIFYPRFLTLFFYSNLLLLNVKVHRSRLTKHVLF